MDDSGSQTAAPAAPGQENSVTSPPSVAHSSLFKLPRELRDYIYEYAFWTPPSQRSITKAGGIPEPALLFTCKIVRQEASLLFYGRQRLILVIDSYNPAVMVFWRLKKEQFTRAYGPTPSGVLNYRHTGPRNWNNLKMMLRLHLAEKIGSLYRSRSGSQTIKDERLFVAGLFKAVRKMKGWQWHRVEDVLDMLRPGLVKLHREWALEQPAAYEYQYICTLLESARLEHLAPSSDEESLITEA